MTTDGQKAFAGACYRLNLIAVHDRYSEMQCPVDPTLFFKYQFNLNAKSMQALKYLKCLIYQCSEEVAMEAPLYKMLQKIEIIWMNIIITGLPEYEGGKWDA